MPPGTELDATAVIVAAGSGSRLGVGGPKALVDIGGKPLVAWSLEQVGRAELIGAVVVAAPSGHEAQVQALAPAATVVTGGASRSASVALALAGVGTSLVLVHDAARPLASAQLFDEIVTALLANDECDGFVAAAPVADTVKRADSDYRVIETLARDALWAIQTPQGFRADALRRALDIPAAERDAATDDASLVERAGGEVRIHPVLAPNPKVTMHADLAVVEALLLGAHGIR